MPCDGDGCYSDHSPSYSKELLRGAEPLAPAGASRATHAAPRYGATPDGTIQARPGSLAVPKEWPPWWLFSLCAGGCESDSAGEHLWATIGTGFTPGPSPDNRQPIVLLRCCLTVPQRARSVKRGAAVAAPRLRPSAFPSGLKAGVPCRGFPWNYNSEGEACMDKEGTGNR
jgi:hypothetical protein